MRLRLRARFALLAAALVLLVSSVVGIVGYLTLRHSLLTRAANTAQVEATRLVSVIGGPESQGNNLDITDAALTSQLSTPGLRVEIDRPSGALIQATRGRSGSAALVPLPGAVRRRCLTTGRALVRATAPAAQLACQRVGPASAPLGTVAVAAPLGDALGSLSALGSALFLAVLGGTALAAVLSLALARRALRPVKQIAVTAETIRRGDLSRRVDYRGHDELGELAGVLDACFAELEDGIERQRRFGADASHELKTPLAAVRANVELLRGWGGLDPQARESALLALDQASRRASRLVADLLALVKLDREPPQTRTRVALDEVVLQAVREATALRSEIPIRVAQLDEAVVNGDPLALGQLLLNLLDNALAASPAGTEVRAALTRHENHATIAVSDRGPGIPPDDLDRIFDRFYSRRSGAAPRISAGLGLAIARAIAVDHGGELVAGNEAAGGATFVLTLPLARTAAPAVPPAAPATPQAARR